MSVGTGLWNCEEGGWWEGPGVGSSGAMRLIIHAVSGMTSEYRKRSLYCSINHSGHKGSRLEWCTRHNEIQRHV